MVRKIREPILVDKKASPEGAAILNAAPPNEPFSWHSAKDTIVIFIHGFLGSPDVFRVPARRLHELGYASAALLLPGHGGDAHAFTNTNELDWISHVHAEIDCLRNGYSRVFLLGHSLGGLLALDYTAEHPENPVNGIILMGTPLGLRFHVNIIRTSLRLYLTPPKEDDSVTAAYRLGFGLEKPLLNPFAVVRPGLALWRMIHQTRKKLSRVKVPTLIIQSRSDETAAPSSASLFSQLLGGKSRVVCLYSSLHAWIHPDERALVEAEIDSFIVDPDQAVTDIAPLAP
ncbi:MAG: alpha/beta fold hydrolase [Ruminococcaceae bacterium]|nr:alpha/beta fold hydrolase [Oscillospiraceae bacterium]